MGKRIAIVQSSYIPWKGYFDIINSVDEFILFDDVQFTRRDWRSRNRIKTPRGSQWITVPVSVKGRSSQLICEARCAGTAWRAKHWKTLQRNYAKAPCFRDGQERFQDLYLGSEETSLSAVNRAFIEAACDVLGIVTPITWSMDYGARGAKTDRLLDLCEKAGADAYLSGPSARGYIDPARFAEAGVALAFASYEGYPPYEQVHPPFDHYVTVLDLIFHRGREARESLLSFRPGGMPSEAT